MTKKQDDWQAILDHLDLTFENGVSSTFDSVDIKYATGDREPRLVCSMDSRSSVPPVLKNDDLFVLPVRNGVYRLVQGKGYEELPFIDGAPTSWNNKIAFDLVTRHGGEGEDPHLLHAYNTGLLSNFLGIDELYQTTAGRRYSTAFKFRVGDSKTISVDGVQFQVDGLFEGENDIVIVEAKAGSRDDFITRQLYYPYRHYATEHDKTVRTVFYIYDESAGVHFLWEYSFDDPHDYTSLFVERSGKYRIDDPQSNLSEF
ncbi:type II restriction enzyme [Haloferax sp. DFSO52]|uniref:type II restriction enzyme n=1 Tax=Haloferax sp. DFSO52 TaxID=3388505 RepID=UPI003A854453